MDMDVTSGEILFRLNNIGKVGKKNYPDIGEEFWNFLDVNGINSSAEELSHTGKAISASVESYILKLRHRILTIRKALELSKSRILHQVDCENQSLQTTLLAQQSRYDGEIIQLILQYYAIIQHEIAASREQLLAENEEKDVLYKQASVLRDIRLFACHLMVESRGKLSFTMLPPESQQFARCVKAVMDNIRNDNLNDIDMNLLRNKIKVLNVFKLQNSFLSSKLQAASERVMNGKIKGLFCCLPLEHFYSFSVFGLHAQALPYKSNANLQQLGGQLFSTAWFHSEAPPGIAVSLRQNKDVAGALRVAGTAARLAVQRSASMGAAPGTEKQSRSAQHILRFSRYSTISNLRDLSQQALEGGVFLALCRVLVVQQLTVTTTIQDADIMAGLQQGCDCVYSSANEEYVLLQPKFVLPEFFMHVQFPLQVSKHTKGSSTSSSNPSRTTAPPSGVLTLPPSATQNKMHDRKQQPADGLFPLENLFLQNATHHLETQARVADGSHITYEEEEEDSGRDLQQTLMRKQAIVQGLQQAVQDFQREKEALVLATVRNLAKKGY